MNRPRITKETLKELRGRLLAEQNSNNQSHEAQSEAGGITKDNGSDRAPLEKEHEQGMDM